MVTIFLFIWFSSLACTQCFLLGPANVTLSYVRRNLMCPQGYVNISNGVTSGTVAYNVLDFDYCVIYEEIYPITGRNVTQLTFSSISRVNDFRSTAISRCGFSSSRDIGYGSCSLFSYDLATSRTLCICSTSNCSSSMASCQASVNQVISSPPPLLPVVIPSLTNRISCVDSYYNDTAALNMVPPLHGGCMSRSPNFVVNQTACYLSAPTLTVLCLIIYYPVQGIMVKTASLEDVYTYYLRSIVLFASKDNVTAIYEGSSNIMLTYLTNSSNDIIFCFCTTNNCNVDLATCSNGINYPQLLGNINGSNISSTISSSTSTMASTTLTITSSSTFSATLSTSIIRNSSSSTRIPSNKSGKSLLFPKQRFR